MHRHAISPFMRVLQYTLMRLRPAPLADFMKRLLRIQRMEVQTADGWFSIDPISNLGCILTNEGRYEASMGDTIRHFLGTGKTFIDLGANEGYFTVIGSKQCSPGGRVVAIEPQQRLLKVISDNIRLNHCEGVVVVNAAITDKHGEAALHLAPSTNSGASGLNNSRRYSGTIQKVATLTLAEVLNQQGLAEVDFMKVDIEGFEYEALLGSAELFRDHRIRAMTIDIHAPLIESRGKSPDDILKMLSGYGYEITSPFGTSVWSAPVRRAIA